MVFCEEPWYNEPGRESQRNAVASENENTTLQGHTIQYAMLPWLQKLPVGKQSARAEAQSGDTDMYVWSDVVRRHFAANGKAILETVKRWKGKRMVDELSAAMQKHGFLD
jgi:baculoviral IAP repeat-containing protein 6